MSIWTRITDALSALTAGESLSDVFANLRTPPERSVAFAIAVIALGAKMAKADGQVTRDEVAAFREVFTIPKGEEKNAGRLFNLARTDVAGFEDYAHKIKTMYGDDRTAPFCDLMEGLFHIALADGYYHPDEDAFLNRVAQIFGLPDVQFKRLRAQFVPDADRDPYDVLGVTPSAPMADMRSFFQSANSLP
jgi:DnaJ like chaperone protein